MNYKYNAVVRWTHDYKYWSHEISWDITWTNLLKLLYIINSHGSYNAVVQWTHDCEYWSNEISIKLKI